MLWNMMANNDCVTINHRLYSMVNISYDKYIIIYIDIEHIIAHNKYVLLHRILNTAKKAFMAHSID